VSSVDMISTMGPGAGNSSLARPAPTHVRYGVSFFFSSSLSWAGLALPPVAFIT